MSNSIQDIFNEAISAFNNRNMQKAEQGFRRVVQLDKSHVPALNLLAVALMSLGRFREAEPFIVEATSLSQNSDVSFYNYGLIAKKLNKLQLAYEQFTKALTLNPGVPESWNNRGTVHNELKAYELAISDFNKSIEINPNYAECYTNKGKSLCLLKRYDEAFAAYDKALALKPDLAEAWLGRGNVSNELKRYDGAFAEYDKAIALKSDLAEAWLGRGNVFTALKRYDEAFAEYDKAIALEPDPAEAWLGRGNVFTALKRYDEAFAAYGKALALKPDLPEAWLGRGNVFTVLKRYDEAFAAYDKALALKPDLPEAWLGRGNVFTVLKRCDEAFAAYDKALALKPELAEAWVGRGYVFTELKRYDEAFSVFDKALALKPEFAEAWVGRGNVFTELKRYDEALVSYDRAIAIKPDYAEAHYNRGNTLKDHLKRLDEALASYDRAIAIKPDHAEAYWNRALARLIYGDLDKGWEEYEWRWKDENLGLVEKRNFRQPLWLGKEPLAGQKILLHSEQGFGDTIQFCRYAKLVADLGAHVILEVPKRLVNLLANLEGVGQLVEKGKVLPAFDYQCPLLSLPLAFKTNLKTIPASVKYLNADTNKIEQWKINLGEKTNPRIGLVWSGRTEQKHDHNRSLLLSDVIQHLPTDFQYICLQKEIRDVDKPILQSNPRMLSFSDEQNDFSDAAALCELMDVIISVDTSVAHLAGALGKPTWVLLPFCPDWRWLLDRTDSPWYPSVLLYRQDRPGDWAGVFEKVRADLLRVTLRPTG